MARYQNVDTLPLQAKFVSSVVVEDAKVRAPSRYRTASIKAEVDSRFWIDSIVVVETGRFLRFAKLIIRKDEELVFSKVTHRFVISDCAHIASVADR